jgi:hypothetical protein
VYSHFLREAIQSAAATFAVGRLIYLSLARRFPALLWFLIFFAVSEGLFALVSPRKLIYFQMYEVYLPAQNILSILAVRELFTLVFDAYPGIQTIGRWAMYAGIVLSAGASAVIAGIFWQGGAGNRASRLFYLEVGQRSVVFSLALIIVTILFVLSRFPTRLSRNTYYSSLFFSLIFLCEAVRLLIDSMAPRLFDDQADGAANAVIALLLVAWGALLVREPAPKISGIHFSRLGEKRLIEQLDSLNEFLTRAGRR